MKVVEAMSLINTEITTIIMKKTPPDISQVFDLPWSAGERRSCSHVRSNASGLRVGDSHRLMGADTPDEESED